MTPAPNLSLDGVLTEMKERSLANRPLLIRLTLLLAFISVLISLAQSSGAFGQAIGFGVSLFAGVAYAGMVIQLLCVGGDSGDVAATWSALSPALAKLIWVSLIVAVGVAAGLILLIVPGLILVTIWIVAPPVAVVERPGVFESLARSRELVRGNGLRVFLFLLLLAIPIFFAAMFASLFALPFGTGMAGIAVATFLLSVAVNPLTAIGPAALYNCLVASEKAIPDEDEKTVGPADSPDPAGQAPDPPETQD